MTVSHRGPEHVQLPERPTYLAPDGSEVRLLAEAEGGGLAHFQLAPGKTTDAVAHRTVEEIWYILAGEGEIWRSATSGEALILPLRVGLSLTIPPETAFQFRSTGTEPLQILGATIPRWPGPEEAVAVPGVW